MPGANTYIEVKYISVYIVPMYREYPIKLLHDSVGIIGQIMANKYIIIMQQIRIR